MHPDKDRLWADFCAGHSITKLGVPLFATSPDGTVETFPRGRAQRPMLKRSAGMDDLVRRAAEACIAAPEGVFDGLIYMMYRPDDRGGVIPLYIGRTARKGRNSGASVNLLNLGSDDSKFARWGYGYAYHMGDLSSAVLPSHPRTAPPKYQRWAEALFENAPSTSPKLRHEVRFWCTTWGPGLVSIWPQFGDCSLAFIEYLLIGVANELFPNELLNREGADVRRPTWVEG